MSTRATCPGRICLGGEDLDWMGGSTLQAAISLGVTAVACLEPGGRDGEVAVRSAWPVGRERIVRLDDAARPRHDALDFPSAALACVLEELGGFSGTVELTSTLPMAAGLASSASCLIATIAAASAELGTVLTKERACQLALRTETTILKSGAGEMDFWACGLGGTRLARFVAERQVSTVIFPQERATIVVGDSGIHAKTAHSIADKRRRFRAGDLRILRYQDSTDALVCEMGDLLAKGVDLAEIGPHVTSCHNAIATLMASSTMLIDQMVAAALHAGATGAKLTGGGEGGCMFAVVPEDVSSFDVARAVGGVNVMTYETTISTDGVMVVRG